MKAAAVTMIDGVVLYFKDPNEAVAFMRENPKVASHAFGVEVNAQLTDFEDETYNYRRSRS